MYGICQQRGQRSGRLNKGEKVWLLLEYNWAVEATRGRSAASCSCVKHSPCSCLTLSHSHTDFTIFFAFTSAYLNQTFSPCELQPSCTDDERTENVQLSSHWWQLRRMGEGCRLRLHPHLFLHEPHTHHVYVLMIGCHIPLWRAGRTVHRFYGRLCLSVKIFNSGGLTVEKL